MSLKVEIRKKLKAFDLVASFETDGEYLGFLGASGSGKSMTLKCIAGIETPDEGRIELNGRVLFDSKEGIDLKPQERRVGYFFQSYALFPHLSVEENIAAGIRALKGERRSRVQAFLKTFRLEGLGEKYPGQLSGGEQQRVALARCLAMEPEVLMLDEPFSALDPNLREQVQSEVLEHLRGYSGEVLMVTHSRDEAYRFCSRLALLERGSVVVSGETKALFHQPERLAAAVMTGCRNLASCEVSEDGTVRVPDWNLVLESEESLPAGVRHVGIRAHHLRLVDGPGRNVAECAVSGIGEAVFEYEVRLRPLGAPDGKALLFMVQKEEWDARDRSGPVFLEFPAGALLFLKD